MLSLNKYESIIWDWNGTLLDDILVCVEIVNKLLLNHNDRQLDKEAYQAVFGFPISEYYQKIGIDLQKESFDELTVKFIGDYDEKVKHCQLHENVIHTLAQFTQQNLNQYILTAAHQESVLPLLDRFSIRNHFQFVAGLDNYRAESKVQRGFDLLEREQVNKQQTVLVGDTIHDYEVARSLGVQCVLIANGHQSKERLQKWTKNKIPVINEINELQGII